MSKIDIGILGANGTVGQYFIQLLQDHPMFEIKTLGGFRSVNTIYSTHWRLDTHLKTTVGTKSIVSCEPNNFTGCRIIFSALDSRCAGDIESKFANNGFIVFSNAKNHRMSPDVPLVVPFANPEHINMIKNIVTNANCSSTGLSIILRALINSFGPIKDLHVTTLQAISGAGYPGIPSWDMVDNIIPFIADEEEKIETELLKILGTYQNGSIQPANIKISATCTRVPVLHGHTISISLSFFNSSPSINEITKCLDSYELCSEYQVNSYTKPIIVQKQENRPQPRLDRMNGNGMSVTVGRIRKCNILGIKMVILSHNTILGAAGSSIMNAELAYKMGLI
jgi:aspartate-semialdehyde dehydrogenase